MPDTRVVVVAAVPLPDHRDGLTSARIEARHPGGVERHRDRDARVQVGVTVVADNGGPVPVNGGNVMVEVTAPAAPRAVIGDPPGEPVPLHRAARVLRMYDLAGQPVPPPGVVGGLVAGQPGTTRRMAVLDMDWPAVGGPVGDLPPAAWARPGQRRVVAALAAGEFVDRVLGDAEQRPRSLTGDQPERAVHHRG